VSTTEAVDEVLPVDAIRRQFPALRRLEAGRPVAYFDGPGGTQVPGSVIGAVTDYMQAKNANRHWHYPTSAATDQLIDSARHALADLLGGTPAEIAFGANMTTLTFHVARALGRRLGEGDEIVVTELDHLANVDPWRAVASERGAAVRVVPMQPDQGTVDWGAFDALVGPRTRIVALGAASNALGTISDLGPALELARSVGATTFVDAVHAAPHTLTDARGMGCDFLVCSAYKFYGPHIGVLFGRESLVRNLDVPKVACQSDLPPERLETGTLNHEGIAGAAAAVDFLASLATGATRRARLARAFAVLHERGEALGARLWEGLTQIPGVRLYGPPPGQPRTPTVSFCVENVPSSAVARKLAYEEAIFVSHGHFYAPNVIEALGLGAEGLVRAGCACYTTREEVDRLVAGVARIAAGGRRGR
jgi:cysteine desulfurase family protein (TIGR01976 family)